MPMVAGSVSISGGGVASGTGFAKQMYDDLEAGTDFQGISGGALAVAKNQLATLANAAATLITHVQSNSAVTTIDDGSAGAIPWAGGGTGTVA